MLGKIILFCCFAAGLQAQTVTRIFQFSLAPGISTNGLHSGGYTSVFSLNATSGYSASNLFFEVGVISNANELGTRGLQIAGLANVTGINAYKGLSKTEADKKYAQGFEANMMGVQIAGAVNSVLSNVYGWQLAGVTNIVRSALTGFQLAGTK